LIDARRAEPSRRWKCWKRRVVPGACIMESAHDLRATPGPIDTPVVDQVRVPDRDRVIRGWRLAEQQRINRHIRTDDCITPRLFNRQRARYAAAEIRRVGDDLPAAIAGVARGEKA